MEHTKSLGTASIKKLVLQYSIPAVLANIVNSIYNIVDRIFIGNLVGEEALASLTIVFPLMLFIFASNGLIGIGTSAIMSNRFGEGNLKKASEVFGVGIFIAVISVITYTTFILMNTEKILLLFGADSTTLSEASAYLKIIVYGLIFSTGSFVLGSAVRVEGRPKLVMVAVILSALTNIILDYFFIAIFNWGVEGAALATIIGQALGFFLLLSYYLRGNSTLLLKFKYFRLNFKIMSRIAVTGFATFISTFGTSVGMLFLNRTLIAYGGIAAITSMGVINSLYTLFIMPILGMQQGIQPIFGYNYGSKQYDRVVSAFFHATSFAMVASTLLFLVLQTFPEFFISFFIESDSPSTPVAINGLKLNILSLPFLCINFFGVALFQSIERGKTALVLSLLKQFVFVLPLIYILPQIWGINGAWLSLPVADFIAIFVTILLLTKQYLAYRKTLA